MPDERGFHMTPEEFRRYGRAVVDWITDYYQRIESFPVLSQVQPGEIRASPPFRLTKTPSSNSKRPRLSRANAVQIMPRKAASYGS